MAALLLVAWVVGLWPCSAPAQGLPRPSRAHTALNDAIDSHRRGDYEQAANMFQQALAWQNDLGANERVELTRVMQLNSIALQNRQTGADQLRQAERAMKEGRTDAAKELLKKVGPNQYLSAADRQRAQQLNEQLQPSAVKPVGMSGTAPPSPLALARTKLQQGRGMLTQGNFDAAEALAREVERMKPIFPAHEDSPAKLLADIQKTRSDAKVLLTQARAAVTANELDRAERLANAAKKAESSWSMHLFSDSPDKVLKDVQTARARTGAKPAEVVRQPTPPVEKEGMFSPMKNFFKGNKTETVVASKPDESQQPRPGQRINPPNPGNANTENARQLLAQARKALEAGNAEQAGKLVEQARKLKPDLQFYDDTPEKVQADITRYYEKLNKGASGSPTGTANNSNNNIQPLGKDEPRAKLREGRELYSQGKLDEAASLARGIKTGASTTRWGLFEDSPDKLLQDVERTRMKRNQEESWHVLAEGRELLKKGDLEGAARAASRADNLHGPYSVWELGDRPEKLRAEVEVAKNKQRRTTVPPIPGSTDVVRNNQGTGGNPPASPSLDPRVQKLITDATTAYRNNDRVKASALLSQAESMQMGLGKGPDPSMFALRKALMQPAQQQPAPVVDATKKHAMDLLAQGRRLQQEGRLVEARQKVVEAMQFRVAFGPDEDSPDHALLQLGSLARKNIDTMVRQATDLSAAAATDPNKYQMAENCLVQAQQLAAGFGLDAQVVESKLAWVRQSQGVVQTGAQTPVVTNPLNQQPTVGRTQVTDQVPGSQGNLTPESLQATGLSLLAQAREKIRAERLSEARDLVAQVHAGPYGLEQQAQALIRDIDMEEYRLKCRAACRTFDAAESAFKRREHGYAASLIRSIDSRMLDGTRQARLKEVMSTPEMQPTALAQGTAPDGPDGPIKVDGSTDPKVVIRVENTSPLKQEPSFAREVHKMQEIKMQELHSKGLQAQREANERASSGDLQRAMEILQEYLVSLVGVQLESDSIAKLRRPIEVRLQQYRTVKGQKDFEQAQADSRTAKHQGRDAIARAEELKQQKVAELIKQFNTLYKEGKYQEAMYKAMLAKEMDPDNVAATAAIAMARTQDSRRISQETKDGRERMMFHGLTEGENEGPFVGIEDPIKYNAKRWDQIKGRTDIKQIAMRGKGPKEQEIERKLYSPVNLNFNATPLKQVIDDLRSWQGINIVPDEAVLGEAGITLDRPVTMKLEGVSLKSALKLMLEQVRLTYVVEDEVLKITTPDHAHGRLVQKVYQVGELVVPLLQSPWPTNFNTPMVPSQSQSQTPFQPGAGTTPFISRSSLSGGQPTGIGAGDPGQGPGNNNAQGAGGQRGNMSTMEQQLMELLMHTVAPKSWNNMGGPGTIDYFPLTMALVINQTLDIHEQVADLLDALRRLQDQEVAVEVRFITVAEGFFERIGLDFNINIKTDRDTARFEPQIVTGQFKPAGFINDFNPSRFIAGLTPAGTFTSDLDIPIRTSSFAQALPPFGGFPNIPGGNGGLELGLAFLSDIQVFLFMEAAQGDQRTNVMQAPKVTLFNGQTSSIFVQDQQFFVTNVAVIQNGGQLAFVPQNQNFAVGVNLTIQAVISADRRYVRLNLNPNMTNLASAVVPLFPVVTPIFPVFDGGFPGNPVLFTQFIQQPVFNTINVSTSVAVPDGGTVLLGGLKRLSEGRNEFGPPVLSKIPYINRLFKNVGYGREVESLMLMVTPRIIINEEEEIRATNVRIPPRVILE